MLIDGTTDTVTNIDPAGNYDFGIGTLDYQIFQHLLEAGPGGAEPAPGPGDEVRLQGRT